MYHHKLKMKPREKNDAISKPTKPSHGLRTSGMFGDRKIGSTHSGGANSTNPHGKPIEKKKRGEVYVQPIIVLMVAFDSLMRFASRNYAHDHPETEWMEFSFIFVVCIVPMIFFSEAWWICLAAAIIFAPLNMVRHELLKSGWRP